MRKFVADYSLILLCLAATVFVSVAVIAVALVMSGIEPSREQLLITSAVGSLLPTITSILALYRVQASSDKMDAVQESTQKTGQLVDNLATDIGESHGNRDKNFENLQQLEAYLHKNFHDMRGYIQLLSNNVALILKAMERRDK